MRLYLLGLCVLVAACGRSRREPLRPYEVTPPRDVKTLPDGSRCEYEWTPVEPGVCRVAEHVSKGKERLTTFRSVACGAQASVCGTARTCDCGKPVALFPCNPEVPMPWPFEEGRPYSRAELAPLVAKLEASFPPRLEAKRDFEGSSCPLVVSPPYLGRCSITAAISEGDATGHVWGSWFVPFGETREACGVPVSCTCDQFKPEASPER
jgi:hypothetical protein